MASSSSPPSPQSSLPRNWIHDVFPSFHGADVRRSFLSHIMKEFRSKGINPFIDNEIKRGEFIGPELKTAIQGSKIAIVLLSKNYASSSWCLDELVEIMKCKEDLGQTVIALFYEVDPTDVKKQTRDFGKAFRETCKGKANEVTGNWRQALEKVATVAGYHSINWDDEATMIENIATDISNMLNAATPSSDFKGLIGMEDHMRKMKPLLRLDLEEVRMIGIWGPPGIGKSTIARCLFNQHSGKFQLRAIMVDIKGNYPRPCLDEGSAQLQLQNKMLSQMLNHKDIVISHLGVAQERLKDKKVFLVLDDVDRLAQLVALAKETGWFGPGSRIIITTENLRVLKQHGISHIYKVDFPTTNQAFQMFCMYAFDQKYPKDGFADLVWAVMDLAGKLPLGLKVMGSYFRGMSRQEWEKALPKLWSSLDGEIESILQFSYDVLCDDDKYLFLHIACFFNHRQIEEVVEHLKKTFPDVRLRLDVLAEKSLISMEDSFLYFECIKMHSLLVKLGRDIVRKQSIHEPGQRQFLVDSGEICEVLMDDEAGSRSVIGIDYRCFNEGELHLSERTFEKMSNLQFLKLESHETTWHSSHGLSYLSPKLRLLDWKYFPMTCLPSNVTLEFLVEFNMPYSKLEKLWDGIKLLRNLKWMDLSSSKNLKELPSLSTATNLQKLNLDYCSSLVELPSSIGNATNLQKLTLKGCSRLVELPSSIGNATNLQKLTLKGCSRLVELPSTIGNATNLQFLNLSYCSRLVELPSSIGNATNLQTLDLYDCSSLVELPSSIGNATNLQKLTLIGCSSLVELPSSIGNATNLQDLSLNGCSNLVELPSSIGNATNLQFLDLSYCSRLVELPSSIGNATNLEKLTLNCCSSLVELPSSIGNATNLQDLSLNGCSSMVELPSIENATNLQFLDLSYCSRLVELPSSIGNATNLQKLTLKGCSRLVELPSTIGNATNLQFLNLSYCSRLVELPSSIGNTTNLQKLTLNGCFSLMELPSSIGNILLNGWNIKLNDYGFGDSWYMRGYSSLAKIPSFIGNATHLTSLSFDGCSSLVEVPTFIGNLHKLGSLTFIGCSKLEVLPVNVNLTWLDHLDFSGCSSLKSFPEISTNVSYLNLSGTAIEEVPPLVKGFSCLRKLILKGCKELLSLPQLPDSLLELDAENCESLERLDCSFPNPDIHIKFGNCFKLNKEAKKRKLKVRV